MKCTDRSALGIPDISEVPMFEFWHRQLALLQHVLRYNIDSPLHQMYELLQNFGGRLPNETDR